MNHAASDSSARIPSTSAEAFDTIYSSLATSTVLHEVWRKAFADEYPEEASPFSFVTRTEIGTLSQALNTAPSRRFVDLGCGSGGPGLVAAIQTGGCVTGLDTSSAAVAKARSAAARMGMTERAKFLVADAANTCLAAASFGGVMSVDALQLMPNPLHVLTEAVRLLLPGGVIAFTTWSLSKPWRNRVAVPDYRCLLEQIGLDVVSYTTSEGWRERQESVYRLIRERRTELETEVGSAVATLLIEEAEVAPEALQLSSRVIVVARLAQRRSPQHAA